MTETAPRTASRALILVQAVLGFAAWLALVLPYVRKVHGLDRLKPGQRYLLSANHVSLLDTILLGGLCWRSGCYPILVLGDRSVWHASRFKELLSRPIGFLLERGKINPARIRELQTFARSGAEFNLVVFPEGTRGDGLQVGPVKAGIYHVAQEARLPLVPVFLQNMQRVSTKHGKLHLLAGLRKVEVHFGAPLAPESYLSMPQEEFTEFVRQQMADLQPTPAAGHSSPVPHRA